MDQRTAPLPSSPLELLGSAATMTADVAGSGQVWRLSDRDVSAGVEAAYRLVAQTHAAALALLAELDDRGLAVQAGAPSTQAWLTASERIRPQQARRDVRLAQLIHASQSSDRDPMLAGDEVEGSAVFAGLTAGDLNIDQAGCISTALDELPDDATTATRLLAETLLVDQAALHGPATLTRLGHRILERIDPDAADRHLADVLAREERDAQRLRSATRFSDGHGSVYYKVRLPIADDTSIWPVLDALATPTPATHDHDPDDQGDGNGHGDGDPIPDDRSPQQRLADAFIEAFRRVSLDGGLPVAGGDRPRAVITIGLNQLRQETGAGTFLDTGDQLSPSAMRHLCCDAQIIPAVLGGTSQLLDLGRARRTFDGPIRLAVITRDRGCIHPGCDRPARWCDVHHVIPWWKGGRTSLDNGVLLCGYHHRLYDTGTWTITFTSDGIPEAIPPPWIDKRQRPRRHTRMLE